MARMSQAADTIVTSGDLTKRIDPSAPPARTAPSPTSG